MLINSITAPLPSFHVPSNLCPDTEGLEIPHNSKKGTKMSKSIRTKKARQLARLCAKALEIYASGKADSPREAAEIVDTSRESVVRLLFILAYGDLELIESVLLGDRSIANAYIWLQAKPNIEDIKKTRSQNVVIPRLIAELGEKAQKLEVKALELEKETKPHEHQHEHQVEVGIAIAEGLRDILHVPEAMRLKKEATNLREKFRRRSSGQISLAIARLETLSHLLLSDTDPGQTVPQEER